LRQINEALSIPLVVHGGSGLSEDQYHRLITGGVAKINYHTSLSDNAMKSVRANNKTANSYAEMTAGVREVIANEVEQCMRQWGSAGRAAEVISRCRNWSTAEQITLFNIEMADIADVQMILNRGRRLLSVIPGVREVSAGHSEAEGAKYRFLWRVLLASPEVAEGYIRHQNYRDFSNRLLSSISSDRQSVLYQSLDTLSTGDAAVSRAASWG
jgi:fructose-bisphosphate aldolase class II